MLLLTFFISNLIFFDSLPLCLLFYLLIWYVGMFKQREQVRTGSRRLLPTFPFGSIPSPEFACVRIWLLVSRITNNDRESQRVLVGLQMETSTAFSRRVDNPENREQSLNVDLPKLADSSSNRFSSAPGFPRRMIQIFPDHVSRDQSCLIDSA